MHFRETAIAGAWLVEPERHEDERGFFARTFCRDEIAAHGLEAAIAQASVSFNPRRGTLRGLHWQAAPHEEIKWVRCTRGAIWDVLVDLRPDSPSRLAHVAVELSAENGLQLYVPGGVAHGFLTLRDDTEVSYRMSVPYHAPSARGARWNDPAFGIDWPAEPVLISERDRTYPDWAP
ncbi:MAG: dTDP-4-dehydrorhamnose 3,5-epimerase [Thermoanaerobaculia bacterium]